MAEQNRVEKLIDWCAGDDLSKEPRAQHRKKLKALVKEAYFLGRVHQHQYDNAVNVDESKQKFQCFERYGFKA